MKKSIALVLAVLMMLSLAACGGGGGSSSKGGALPGVDMKKLLPLVTAIAGAKTDDRAANLLLALRPLLSPQRAPKIDKAVSLLKIMALLPILEEHGFSVSDFFG